MFVRNCLACILVACLATFAGSTLAAGSDGDNPLVGVWKLDLGESIPPQGVTFPAYKVVVKEAGDVLSFTYYAKHNGKTFEFSFDGKADGTVYKLEHGLKGAMTRLPSGNYEAEIWEPGGAYEDKFCQIADGGQTNVCFATVTLPDGGVVFRKDVLKRVGRLPEA